VTASKHQFPQPSSEAIETLPEFIRILLSQDSGMVTIKPRVLFQIIEESNSTPPLYSTAIPSSKIGSITTLEASLLCSLLMICKPSKIFEFGTFLGYTTSLFLLNSSPNTKVVSLDLPEEKKPAKDEALDFDWEKVQTNDDYNDRYLSHFAQRMGEIYLKRFSSDSRLELIKIDSRFLVDHLEELNYRGKFDYIFIDGGHSFEIASIDTHNAMIMLSERGVLIWHDYGSQLHTNVTDVVEMFARDGVIVRIQSTMLAFYFADKQRFLHSLNMHI